MEDFQAILKRAAKALRTVAAAQRRAFQEQLDAADPVPGVADLRRIAGVFEKSPSDPAEFRRHILNSISSDDLDILKRLVASLDLPSFAVDKKEAAARGDLISTIGDAIGTLGPYADSLRALDALSNPDYEWRTVEGISRETKLDPEAVAAIINGLPDMVLKSRVPDRRGRDLFTTRRHYLSSQGAWSRLLDHLKFS